MICVPCSQKAVLHCCNHCLFYILSYSNVIRTRCWTMRPRTDNLKLSQKKFSQPTSWGLSPPLVRRVGAASIVNIIIAALASERFWQLPLFALWYCKMRVLLLLCGLFWGVCLNLSFRVKSRVWRVPIWKRAAAPRSIQFLCTLKKVDQFIHVCYAFVCQKSSWPSLKWLFNVTAPALLSTKGRSIAILYRAKKECKHH